MATRNEVAELFEAVVSDPDLAHTYAVYDVYGVNERPGADIPDSEPFKALFPINLTDESALYIAGERGHRAVVLEVDANAIVEAIETGTIKRFDAGQIAAALDAIEELPLDHAFTHVRDAARARKDATAALAEIEAR
jgi:hypothetical protein